LSTGPITGDFDFAVQLLTLPTQVAHFQTHTLTRCCQGVAIAGQAGKDPILHAATFSKTRSRDWSFAFVASAVFKASSVAGSVAASSSRFLISSQIHAAVSVRVNVSTTPSASVRVHSSSYERLRDDGAYDGRDRCHGISSAVSGAWHGSSGMLL